MAPLDPPVSRSLVTKGPGDEVAATPHLDSRLLTASDEDLGLLAVATWPVTNFWPVKRVGASLMNA